MYANRHAYTLLECHVCGTRLILHVSETTDPHHHRLKTAVLATLVETLVKACVCGSAMAFMGTM